MDLDSSEGRSSQCQNNASRDRTIHLDDPLISEEEAAKILRVSERTLQRFRLARRIAYVTIGRTIFFRKSAIERFLENCTVRAR
jgi:excisionase family DNA binding protein